MQVITDNNSMVKQKKITLCYRKIIAYPATGTWEKLLHEDTWTELKMQFQLFDPEKKHHRFSELLRAEPQAEKMHFLVSAAAAGYIGQLNGRVPDIKDDLGRSFLFFTQYRFEVIASDTGDIKEHVVAVNFFTAPLTWCATVGDHLLVSAGENGNEKETAVHTFRLQPFLSIHSILNDDI